MKKKYAASEKIKDEALENSKNFCTRIASLDNEYRSLLKKHDRLQLIVQSLVEHEEFCKVFQDRGEPEFDKDLLKYLESTCSARSASTTPSEPKDALEIQRLQNLVEKYQNLYTEAKTKKQEHILKTKLVKKKKQLAGALRHIKNFQEMRRNIRRKFKEKEEYCRKLETKLLDVIQQQKLIVTRADTTANKDS